MVTTVNGSATVTETACRAASPPVPSPLLVAAAPASSSAAATTPSVVAQKARLQVGGSGSPPEDSMSMTSEPESEDVTKKVTTRTTDRDTTTVEKGSPCSISNSAVSVLTLPSEPMSPPSPSTCRYSAAPPSTENHSSVTSVGTSSTPATNSRTVRPREMRAMNTPTKGAHEIHQPQ